MRQISTFVVIFGLIGLAGVATAQSLPDDARLSQAASPGSTAYGTGAGATFPHTTYDDHQQSVYIVDEPAASITPLPTNVGVPPSGVYLASAMPRVGGAETPAIYQPGQQFQLLDSTHSKATASPVAYNTIESPCLSPGECVPDCIDYSCEPWTFQVLPQGLIWHSYLAGPKEPRFEALIIGGQNVGEKFDGEVGGRVGLFRYGNTADFRPQGWQVDVEGAAIIREDEQQAQLVDGYDFRVGVPVTYGWGNYTMKISWYHTSAHLGDEFMLANPTFPRINYSRNAIVWGLGYYLMEDVRIYGEVDYGYWTDGGNKPWAFQFGWEYSPVVRELHGAPFVAMNGFLRQENDYGGFFTFETGWQWRGARGGQLIRAGFIYQNGPNTLNEFFRFSEQQIGGGLWYDF